ncbi:hypothetical protein [Rothia koreensis]|nr:hypothetical protein [Rothia koreensis]
MSVTPVEGAIQQESLDTGGLLLEVAPDRSEVTPEGLSYGFGDFSLTA